MILAQIEQTRNLIILLLFQTIVINILLFVLLLLEHFLFVVFILTLHIVYHPF